MSERQTGSSEMYGIGDQEILNTNLNDCVERYLDAIPPGDLPKHAPVVKVEHYRPRALESGALFMDTHLDALYESLDEEYGNPEGDATEPTQAVRQAWQTFLDVVRAEYVSWFCDPTGETTEVDLRQWIRDEAPIWMNPDKLIVRTEQAVADCLAIRRWVEGG